MIVFPHLTFSSPIIFIFPFIYFYQLWGDDSISSPKNLCGDKILRHQLFLFYLLCYGVTILLCHLKYCLT